MTNNETVRKGDWFKSTPTQDSEWSINVSFTDELETVPATQASPEARERLCLLLENGANGKENACVYLGVDQVDSLIRQLQEARSIWGEKF